MQQYSGYNGFNNLNLNAEYPYGELPLKYTKQGQEALKQERKNRMYPANQNANYNSQPDDFQNNNVNALNTQSQNFSEQSNPQQNQFDIFSLLPLLIGLNNNNSGQLDMINKLMPIIKNHGQFDMQSLLKLFGELNKKNAATSCTTCANKTNSIVIDDLPKVE